MSLAKRLKEARLRAGFSQERLGVVAGIDEMSASARMNQYERGKHVPDLSMLERLASVLNVPAAYFYAADDDLARLLMMFHRLTQADKKRVLATVEEIYGN
ncbi:helix-turn-helix transcriptional regulator [Collimonas sp.]|jgi:transcriptional regulator with XRE-family HTH domain|uniref:helix-turn-helix domain-containing protein n=1 Tax=Collimonas sp. TaxID=1963772 RepID=UPI002C47B42B|nr:helix-turn-helix transcriptional regulator [Collimonas sp.]HWW03717.1 helix-turn-helix transcriptional regulator [Collimonas sp.]